MAHTILFNSSTGSNTQASGAGPATAVFGTNASYSGSVFTLDGSPDLSGVVAGTAILWVDTSTGREFFDISSVNDGADTVTVVTAPAGTSTGLTWAIGGKRATVDGSRTLFVDAKAAWVIEAEDDGSLSLTSTSLTVSASATLAVGKILLRGKSGAKRVCNQSANAANFAVTGSHWEFQNLTFTNSNPTKTSARAITYASGNSTYVNDCILGDSTNQILNGVHCLASLASIRLFNTEIKNCTGDAISNGAANVQNIDLYYCNIHDNAGHGIAVTAAGAEATIRCRGTIFDTNAGDGINCSPSTNFYRMIIDGCTFYGNVDGIDVNGAWAMGSIIINTIFDTNSGTGLKFSGSAADAMVQTVDYNNFNGNGAARSGITAGTNDQALDPQFVNAGTGDFRIGTNLKGLGWPGTLPG